MTSSDRPLQKTVKGDLVFEGIGLHSGEPVSLRLCPAAEDHGIVFHPEGGSAIVARFDRVVRTVLNTTLGNEDGTTVQTVEHFLAALYGCGILNGDVFLSGREAPVMDGSARPFVEALGAAAVLTQTRAAPILEILKPIEVEEQNRWALFLPHPLKTLHLDITVDFPSPFVGRQSLSMDLTEENFRTLCAGARTFGFMEDLQKLQAQGLAKGASLENAVAIGAAGVLNPEGLRFKDECVRHKMLDVVGDLSLCGAFIWGEFQASAPGHGLTNKLLRALFAHPDAFRLLGGGST